MSLIHAFFPSETSCRSFRTQAHLSASQHSFSSLVLATGMGSLLPQEKPCVSLAPPGLSFHQHFCSGASVDQIVLVSSAVKERKLCYTITSKCHPPKCLKVTNTWRTHHCVCCCLAVPSILILARSFQRLELAKKLGGRAEGKLAKRKPL